MIHHNIYKTWAWTGGHADGDPDLIHVAIKEAIEETGVKHFHVVSEEILSLDVLTVDGHIKKRTLCFKPPSFILGISFRMQRK